MIIKCNHSDIHGIPDCTVGIELNVQSGGFVLDVYGKHTPYSDGHARYIYITKEKAHQLAEIIYSVYPKKGFWSKLFGRNKSGKNE